MLRLLIIAIVVLMLFYGLDIAEKMSANRATTRTTVAFIDVPAVNSGKPSMYVPSPHTASYDRRELVGIVG